MISLNQQKLEEKKLIRSCNSFKISPLLDLFLQALLRFEHGQLICRKKKRGPTRVPHLVLPLKLLTIDHYLDTIYGMDNAFSLNIFREGYKSTTTFMMELDIRELTSHALL